MGSSTPEGKIKDKVKALFREHKVWYFLPGNNGFGRSGVPDFVACVDGYFIGVECKADKTKKPTALQLKCGEQIRQAGGVWLLVYDDETLAGLLNIVTQAQDMNQYVSR